MEDIESPIQQDEFMPVPLSTLQADTATGFDLYLQVKTDAPHTLYREKSLPFTSELKLRLVDNGIEELFVPLAQRKEYVAYMEAIVDVVMEDDTVDQAERTRIYYDAAEHIVRDIFEEASPDSTVPRCENLVLSAVSFLRREKYSKECFLKVLSLDYSTYTHAVNSFLYAIHLGQAVGVDDPEDLADLGLAALLMDIGKTQIDLTILYRRGALNDEQMGRMKEHPRLGHTLAQRVGVTNDRILDVILHHHEVLTGSGYPDRLRGNEIGQFVRIATICDIFDALTTNRSHQDAISSFGALRHMQEDMGDDLDPKLFRTFVQMLADKRSGA